MAITAEDGQAPLKREELPMTAPKARAAVALLAIRIGSPVSVLDLEWALRGDREPDRARKALQHYIEDLRKILPDDAIETTPQGYRLLGSKASVRSRRASPESDDQILTTGQVMVRVMPSICWMSRTTMRPSSFTEPASARAMTS